MLIKARDDRLGRELQNPVFEGIGAGSVGILDIAQMVADGRGLVPDLPQIAGDGCHADADTEQRHRQESRCPANDATGRQRNDIQPQRRHVEGQRRGKPRSLLMVFGNRQVVNIEPDIRQGEYEAGASGSTTGQAPRNRGLFQRLLGSRHLLHQPGDLHHIADHAETQLCIVHIHLNLKGNRQCRHLSFTVLVIPLAHFGNQRLNRKGETQAAPAVGFTRMSGLAGQGFHQSLKVVPDLAEPRVGGGNLECVLRVKNVSHGQRVTRLRRFFDGVQQRQIFTSQFVLGTQKVGGLGKFLRPVTSIQLRQTGPHSSVFTQGAGAPERLLFPDRHTLNIRNRLIFQKAVESQIRRKHCVGNLRGVQFGHIELCFGDVAQTVKPGHRAVSGTQVERHAQRQLLRPGKAENREVGVVKTKNRRVALHDFGHQQRMITGIEQHDGGCRFRLQHLHDSLNPLQTMRGSVIGDWRLMQLIQRQQQRSGISVSRCLASVGNTPDQCPLGRIALSQSRRRQQGQRIATPAGIARGVHQQILRHLPGGNGPGLEKQFTHLTAALKDLPTVFTLRSAADLLDPFMPSVQRQRLGQGEHLELPRGVRVRLTARRRCAFVVCRLALTHGVLDGVVASEHTAFRGLPSDIRHLLPSVDKSRVTQARGAEDATQYHPQHRAQVLRVERAVGDMGKQFIQVAGELDAMGSGNLGVGLRDDLLTRFKINGEGCVEGEVTAQLVLHHANEGTAQFIHQLL
ncbi:hypothetical protein SRM1_00670 [Pseudomonas fluorescens]|nr:hypothetical protein SRM1_00670 [Pseudomonas fluorescens]